MLIFLTFHLFQFGLICLYYKEYKQKLRLSKQIIGYDIENLFEFLNKTLNYLLEDINEGFEKVFVKNKLVF